MTTQRLSLTDEAQSIRSLLRHHRPFELRVGRRVYDVDQEGFYSTPPRWIKGSRVLGKRMGRVVVAWPQLREENVEKEVTA